MAKKKYHRGKKKFTVPVALAAPLAVMALDVGKKVMSNDLNGIKGTYTGVWEDNKFNPNQIVDTYTPLVVGLGVHILASKLGVNKSIGQAGVPIFRL